jgi:hypothetical protein
LQTKCRYRRQNSLFGYGGAVVGSAFRCRCPFLVLVVAAEGEGVLGSIWKLQLSVLGDTDKAVEGKTKMKWVGL